MHLLVNQLPESAFPEFDDLVQYEDALIDTLDDVHQVDGHDIGSGEVNFFVVTDAPTAAFATIRDTRGGVLLSHPEARGASRPLDGDVFEPLWPPGDQRAFTIV